ncbi:phosphoribosyl transferase [Bodo saltans virus]|uniref:Phosphoribosyl transferase n=1 Tax=Bodo saltans virus TaxID=2024608 RepID=A0A2H4UVP9_9VIRU|nr:phosphoribosyl transferase [Bodo saltans virus]ATZ81002.1 phosphoribosyl transferase [Bodo saltans virus]
MTTPIQFHSGNEFRDCVIDMIAKNVVSIDNGNNEIIATSGAKFSNYLGLLSSILSPKISKVITNIIHTELHEHLIPMYFNHIPSDSQLIIVGPEISGAIIVSLLKNNHHHTHSTLHDIQYVYFNAKNNSMSHFSKTHKHVYAIIAEDVLATGTSLCEATKFLEQHEIKTIAAIYLIDRPEARENLPKVPLNIITFPVYIYAEYADVIKKISRKMRTLHTVYPKITCKYDTKKIELTGTPTDITQCLRKKFDNNTILIGYEGMCSHICTDIFTHNNYNNIIVICRNETKKTGTKQRFEYPFEIENINPLNQNIVLFVEHHIQYDSILDDLFSQFSFIVNTIYIITFIQ